MLKMRMSNPSRARLPGDPVKVTYSSKVIPLAKRSGVMLIFSVPRDRGHRLVMAAPGLIVLAIGAAMGEADPGLRAYREAAAAR